MRIILLLIALSISTAASAATFNYNGVWRGILNLEFNGCPADQPEAIRVNQKITVRGRSVRVKDEDGRIYLGPLKKKGFYATTDLGTNNNGTCSFTAVYVFTPKTTNTALERGGIVVSCNDGVTCESRFVGIVRRRR